MNYTRCPIQLEQFNAPHFDKHQFADHGRFLRGSRLDFKDVQRMHLQPFADLRKGRKVETPAWVLSDAEFRETLVRYLESRYQIHKPTGSLKERLDRCKAAGKARAQNARLILMKRVAEFRELWGRSPADSLQRLRLQISCIDSEAVMSERAAELATACAYLYYRMGFNSPSVSEELKVLTPVHVRQIICRLNRAARRHAQGTSIKIGRPASQKSRPVSGQIPEKKVAWKRGTNVTGNNSPQGRNCKRSSLHRPHSLGGTGQGNANGERRGRQHSCDDVLQRFRSGAGRNHVQPAPTIDNGCERFISRW